MPVALKEYKVDFSSDRATKNGWPTYMEKEIHEQPDAVGATLADRIDSFGHLALDEVRIPESVLRSVDKVIMIGCGHRLLRWPGRALRDRALVSYPRRGRAFQRVPLPRPRRR